MFIVLISPLLILIAKEFRTGSGLMDDKTKAEDENKNIPIFELGVCMCLEMKD